MKAWGIMLLWVVAIVGGMVLMRVATSGSGSADRQGVVPARRSSSVYFANCSEARAWGAAPVYAGEPGYRSGLDRDSDGIGCE